MASSSSSDSEAEEIPKKKKMKGHIIKNTELKKIQQDKITNTETGRQANNENASGGSDITKHSFYSKLMDFNKKYELLKNKQTNPSIPSPILHLSGVELSRVEGSFSPVMSSTHDFETETGKHKTSASGDGKKQKKKKEEAMEKIAERISESEDVSFNKEQKKKRSKTSESEDLSLDKNQNREKKKKGREELRKKKKKKRDDEKQPSEKSALLMEFEGDFKTLTKIEGKAGDWIEDDSDEEVFLMSVPARLDANSLVGTKISLKKRTRVPKGVRNYDCVPSFDSRSIVVAIPSKVRALEIAGNLRISLNLEKDVCDSRDDVDLVLVDKLKSVVAFPDDLKCRHPLFGIDFAEKIKLETGVEEKLRRIDEAKPKRKKAAKVVENENDREIFSFLEPTTGGGHDRDVESRKKRKKRKASDETSSRKKTKGEKKAGSQEDDVSSLLIHEMLRSKHLELSNVGKHKKKKKKSKK